jgi:hypothetical protein
MVLAPVSGLGFAQEVMNTTINGLAWLSQQLVFRTRMVARQCLILSL